MALLGLLILAGGVLLLASTSPTATPYAKMIGLNGTRTDSSHDYIADAQAMGAQWERVVQWNETAEDGTPAQDEASLNSHGIRAFITVNSYSTSWVQNGSCSGANYTGTCTGKAAWVQAILHAATTYGTGGSYWAGKTDYGSPVIEVANEPYGSWYSWPDQGYDHPEEYAKMIDQAARAVNTATGGKVKLLAAVETAWCDPFDTSKGSCTWHSWGQDLQTAVPGLAAELGGITDHPYGDVAYMSAGKVVPVACKDPSNCSMDSNYSHQELYTAHSQWPSLPVYVTEVGQKAGACDSTSSIGCSAGDGQVGLNQQKAAIDYYFNELKTNSWEAGLFWYNQKDYHPFDPNADNGWALIDSNNTHKPAEAAYKTDATALESGSGSGTTGDTTPPTVSLSAPATGATVSGTTSVSAAASDNVGVASVQFKLDGQALGSAATSSPYSVSWDTTKVASGSHALTATATDAAGNASTSAPVTVTVNNQTGGNSGYHVSGNVILDSNGTNFFLHGVDRPSLEWTCAGLGVAGGSGIPASDFSTMKAAWGANSVRISVSQDLWLGGAEAQQQGCTGAQYQSTLKAAITAARNAGLVVVLDLHWSDKGNLQGSSGQQCMPDANSNTFWQQAASAYKGDTGVWYELYNEPQMDTSSWSIWKNGGSVCGFTAVGMQTLVNTIRATGATNMVLAGGVGYASHLDGLVTPSQNYLLSGGNVAYVIHPYANPSAPNSWSTSDWSNRFGYLTTQVPVVATEFGNPQQTGSAACVPSTYDQGILDYLRTHGIGYTAWAWYADIGGSGKGPCGFPVLISDTKGTCYANDGACSTQADLLGFASGKLQMTVPGQSGGQTPPTVQNFTWNAASKTLTWAAYPNAVGYVVATVHDPTGARNTTYLHLTGTSYTPPALNNETVHYGILPVDANWNGLAGATWASEVSVTWLPLADTTPPSTPTGVTAAAASSSQINLSWTASTDNVAVTGYEVFRNGGSTPLATVTGTSYGDTGLAAGTTYSYTVKAVDGSGNVSAASASVSATTQSAATRVTVRGTVTNTGGTALGGVYVHTGVHATGGSTMATAYTDGQGGYVLTNITPDRSHSYSFSLTNYHPRTFSKSFPAGTSIMNIALKLLSQ